MKGKELLARHNIPSSVQKELRSLNGGCVYTLQFSDRYEEVAKELLQNSNILHKSETRWLEAEK